MLILFPISFTQWRQDQGRQFSFPFFFYKIARVPQGGPQREYVCVYALIQDTAENVIIQDMFLLVSRVLSSRVE